MRSRELAEELQNDTVVQEEEAAAHEVAEEAPSSPFSFRLRK